MSLLSDNSTISALATAAISLSSVESLDYCWCFASKPAGSTATITNSNQVVASFVPDVVGGYWIQLTVSNGCARNHTFVYIEATCSCPPVANAGAPSTVSFPVGQYVPDAVPAQILDGYFSYDADSNVFTLNYPLGFEWTLVSWSNSGTMRMVVGPLDAQKNRVYSFLQAPPTVPALVTSEQVVSTQSVFSDSVQRLVGPLGVSAIEDFPRPTTQFFATKIITSNVTTVVKSQQVVTVQPPVLSNCDVTIFNATAQTTTWSARPYSQCLGLFSFQLRLSDGCSNSTDIVSTQVSCPASPFATLQCNVVSQFNYTARAFPTILVDSRSSSDNDTVPFNRTWWLQPPVLGTLLPWGYPPLIANFTPTSEGQQVVGVTVSDGCSSALANVTATSTCLYDQPTVSAVVLETPTAWSTTGGFNTPVVFQVCRNQALLFF